MRVLLVDDHDLFRQGLKFLLADLERGIAFFDAETSANALAYACGEAMNLVLVDLNMPGANGMDALGAMCAAFEESAVVVLSSEDDPRLIRKAIEMGASGFIPKSSTPQVLIAALRLVLAGGTYLPPHVLRGYASQPPAAAPARAQGKTAAHSVDGLSGRQLEVLMKVVQGKANKVIAREMQLSEGTVKAHLSAAFRTLGVQNRTEAVFVAAKGGLTRPGTIAHVPM